MIALRKITSGFSFAAKMSQIVRRDAERAKRIQENVIEHQYAVEMEAKIRQRMSVDSSVEKMEEEMREQIARSLKNSELKVLYLIDKAEKAYEQHIKMPKTTQEINKYNELIRECQKARWEFMVHRQACGFTIKNYELVTTRYKIPPKIQ